MSIQNPTQCQSKSTPLREQMIDLMTVKNFAESTQKSYLYGVTSFANYYHKSPSFLNHNDVQKYLIYLMKDKKLSPNSCRLHLQGIRFLYKNVLHNPIRNVDVLYPKKTERIPDLLTSGEALAIINSPQNIKHRCQLMLCYACGLRVSEVLSLRVKNIDGQHQQIKIEQGKGMKDRFVPVPEELLQQLRIYWLSHTPRELLFYCGENKKRALTVSTLQRVFKRSKKRVKISKDGGIHSLRHAFATHQLEAGLPLHILQRWMGHNDIHTTMRYIHWVPAYQSGKSKFVNLLRRLDS